MILYLCLAFQIKEEFKRITTVYLKRTFLSKLDSHTTKLVEIFRKKGGIAGTKIKPMLDSLSEDVSHETVRDDSSQHIMKIVVIHPSMAQENRDSSDVSVIIEGREVLEGCRSVANACLLLMGVIYALNLSYPLKLKYTFEVFQKLFLELDILKMSSKVQALHKKLLA
ncbi:hypothetical protein PAMP_022894 [Pampus punctatissimus]